MNRTCNTCHIPIPPKRLEILPTATTCVKCSEEERWSAIHVIHHKTGNEVQVVKDSETAKEFNKLSSRAGFGTLRGMRSGKAPAKKKKTMSIGTTAFITGKPETFERIGHEAMEAMDLLGFDWAKKIVDKAVSNRNISHGQGLKILNILQTISTKV